MSFYTSISEHYREIFPLNPAQPKFVIARIPNASNLSLLDIGCGTGDLCLALSNSFRVVTGIDLDEEMLEIAQGAKGEAENVDFHHLNMLEIGSFFALKTYDAILCFGNTLIHLANLAEITRFLGLAKSLLRPGGKLLLQIINYDRILDLNIKSLPTLDTDDIRFVRNYHYRGENQQDDRDRVDPHQIEFETILTVKSTDQVIRNQIPLFPIRKAALENRLLQTGFTNLHFFGNFKGDPFNEEGIPLILDATA